MYLWAWNMISWWTTIEKEVWTQVFFGKILPESKNLEFPQAEAHNQRVKHSYLSSRKGQQASNGAYYGINCFPILWRQTW